MSRLTVATVATVRELITSGAVETYADGYGVWHAHVPKSCTCASDAAAGGFDDVTWWCGMFGCQTCARFRATCGTPTALPDMAPERLARAAIRLELSDRGDITGYRLRVAREPVRTYAATQSARIHFREV